MDKDTQKTEAPKKLTITLTDRPPVKITEDSWPIIAAGSWSDHDNQYECQANRKWSAWIKVRQHKDGRTIVYGRYYFSSQFQGESGEDYRDGQIITPQESDCATLSTRIVDAIRGVGERLAERSGHERWVNVVCETIADLPADELPDSPATIDGCKSSEDVAEYLMQDRMAAAATLIDKWIEREREWRQEYAHSSRISTIAVCRREMQEALGLVASPEVKAE